ncbi:hypothetical protein VE02_05018 [Pseudogymnoascus sp. 03VT05]|nr:hypothetical protein VE02_05018 [Pseudogymnoascus sp. 03VT05]
MTLPKSSARPRVYDGDQRSSYAQQPSMGYRPQNKQGGHQQHGYNQQNYSNSKYSEKQTRDDRDDSLCCF